MVSSTQLRTRVKPRLAHGASVSVVKQVSSAKLFDLPTRVRFLIHRQYARMRVQASYGVLINGRLRTLRCRNGDIMRSSKEEEAQD